MKKINLAIVVVLLGVLRLIAQTPRQPVIEHFTNTYCSICASKNPQFYSNLHANYPQFLHIAYYPSAPYPQCYFNNQNKPGNDDRTKYYDVYGSTPRAVIQGSAVAIQNPLVTDADYQTAIGLTSPFEVNVQMRYTSSDSVTVTTVVKTTAQHSYTVLHLYAPITEDTIFYAAHNGENIHYDVFRSQLFAGNGAVFEPGANVGDSVIIIATFKPADTWTRSRINVTALVQDTVTKEILQAARQKTILPAHEPTDVSVVALSNNRVFPNPASGTLNFVDEQPKNIWLYDLLGNTAFQANHITRQIQFQLPNGVYVLKAELENGKTLLQKITISR